MNIEGQYQVYYRAKVFKLFRQGKLRADVWKYEVIGKLAIEMECIANFDV
jgi:hypothetical protein